MPDNKLQTDLQLLSQMLAQADTYMHSIKENITGSSPYWNAAESSIDDAIRLVDETEKLLVPLIYWTENALDIHYAPTPDEQEQLIAASLRVAASFTLLEEVFIREIYPDAESQWLVKIKNFLQVSNFYLNEIDSLVRSKFGA